MDAIIEVLGLKHDRIPRRDAERAIRRSGRFGGANCMSMATTAEASYLSAAPKMWDTARDIMGTQHADDRGANPPFKFLQMGYIHSADHVREWLETTK